MKKIRIGNDFTITRTIVRGDSPEDLVNVFNPKLELISYFAVPTVNPPYTISDVNKIDVNIETQYVPKVGKYKLVFSYDVPEAGFVDDFRKVTIDIANFEIVSESSKADNCNDVAEAGQIEIGIKGDSAFRVWLGEDGNSGKTKEDYFNWLQEPASEVVNLANSAAQDANTATGLANEATADYYDVVKPEIISQGEYATAQGDYAKAQGEAVEGAITDLQTDLGLKLDKSSVKQITGTSETDVMSQKAVTDELAQLADDVNQNVGRLLVDYVHNSNKEVHCTGLDLATGTFTSIGHRLVDGDIIFPTYNDGITEFPYDVYPLGLIEPNHQGLQVTDATSDTFKVYRAETSTALSFTEIRSLNKWHFEVAAVSVIFNSLPPNLYAIRILMSGKKCGSAATHILINGLAATIGKYWVREGGTESAYPDPFSVSGKYRQAGDITITTKGYVLMSSKTMDSYFNSIAGGGAFTTTKTDKLQVHQYLKNIPITSIATSIQRILNGYSIRVYKL